MSLLVYLVRAPVSRLHPCLYAPTDNRALVIGIEQARGNVSSHAAEVISPGSGTTCTAGQFLSYGELLQLVMNAGKIITL